jgi:hypothetical protein
VEEVRTAEEGEESESGSGWAGSWRWWWWWCGRRGRGSWSRSVHVIDLADFFHGNIGIVHIEHWFFGFVQIFWGSVVDDEGFLQIPFDVYKLALHGV